MNISIYVGTSTDPDKENETYIFIARKTSKGFLLISEAKKTSLADARQQIKDYAHEKGWGANIINFKDPGVVTIGNCEGERYYVTPLEEMEILELQTEQVT